MNFISGYTDRTCLKLESTTWILSQDTNLQASCKTLQRPTLLTLPIRMDYNNMPKHAKVYEMHMDLPEASQYCDVVKEGYKYLYLMHE